MLCHTSVYTCICWWVLIHYMLYRIRRGEVTLWRIAVDVGPEVDTFLWKTLDTHSEHLVPDTGLAKELKKNNYQKNSAMIFHLNHLFNPAKRSMHMYVTEYRKIKTCHWKTQCRHKYLTGYNQLNPERHNFFSPAKLGPWPRQVCTLSLRGNMDCMRLLLDLVLSSQSVLLYVHVCRLYNAYRIAALFYLLSKTY